MRTLAVAFGLCAALGVARADSVEGGKVFTGGEGVQVSIVFLRPRSDGKTLVQVTGSGSEIDGKVRLHMFSDDNGRVDYRGTLHGRDFHTVIARNGRYELYVPGRRDDIAIKYDEGKSKALNGEALFAAYLAQQKDGSLAALERFDRDQRVRAAEADLAAQAAAVNKACGGKLAVEVSWPTINDDMLGSLSIGSYCGAPLAAMTQMCESADARGELSQVKKLSCAFGPAMNLELAGEALRWTTSKDGSNMEQFAERALKGDDAPADGPPWGKAATLGQKMALGKTLVCSDGKSHYVAIAPEPERGEQLFYGDGKKFVSVPPLRNLSPTDFLDPRFFNKTSNPNFRGFDMRVVSSVEADRAKQTCAARCGDRTIALRIVAGSEARPMLLAASFVPTPQKHLPHVLLRDERGVYYYVDRGFKPSEEKKFRLFKGQKGSLKEQKMTNVVSDSEGEIFSTKTGSLRLIVDHAKASVWIENGKSVVLRGVPVDENLQLIYNELGVYLGERMGTPCDDL